MPVHRFLHGELGTVAIYKRRKAKSIKLSLSHNGEVRVTMPLWAPYKLGITFIEQKKDWLVSKRNARAILHDLAPIGKAHRLVFESMPTDKVTSRVSSNTVRIIVPLELAIDSEQVQAVARKACVRALMQEAKKLLPMRLAILASKHDFIYRSVKIKELRGRWGSCSQHKDIVLNCYLIQLPWNLIDYVILHELVHTRLLAHGKPFWDELKVYVPNLLDVRKVMRNMQPTVLLPNSPAKSAGELERS